MQMAEIILLILSQNMLYLNSVKNLKIKEGVTKGVTKARKC